MASKVPVSVRVILAACQPFLLLALTISMRAAAGFRTPRPVTDSCGTRQGRGAGLDKRNFASLRLQEVEVFWKARVLFGKRTN